MSRIIAFHLPQFHSIPENDRWWGPGFTEWTNVKKSTPLFNGHQQPKIPLDHHYYDLTCPDAVRAQCTLAEAYGVDGFCYYHYWFSGHKLLHRPLEIRLAQTNITHPFCLAWANEPWTRAWNGRDHDILMPQTYGNINDWAAHYHYLRQFFQIAHYITHHGRPVLILYRPQAIPCLSAMLECWREISTHHHEPMPFIVGMHTAFGKSATDSLDASIQFEPMYTLSHQLSYSVQRIRQLKRLCRNLLSTRTALPESLLDRLSYDKLWHIILSNTYSHDTWPCGFVGWDNSARRQFMATIVEGSTPEKFQQYMTLLLHKSLQNNAPFVFLNAWNEWAEGAYLEPDIHSEYDFLYALQSAKNSI